ncbi:pyridoxamine 5'-phosphate oxidase family protein [uncultured Thiothrix sp.]|uniref:pyridoxamine 5'-phosphate oxidase family protein n=1 Tax=uncultured Thiothrix sp. TaxID=223185 RepID=UPI002635DF62|nr:pyridoxamine 5'-phosphate oxidase family protein [uncultured Thiothrix sp.]
MSPLAKLYAWVAEERLAGNRFSHGAVLGTIDKFEQPHTRMLGVHFDKNYCPRFHTSPTSRKVVDLTHNQQASLTFAFQTSLRSVSLEGCLVALSAQQLDNDWLKLESSFRRSYMIFGNASGTVLESADVLENALANLPVEAELVRPAGFMGYQFATITRIAFYSVSTKAFAEHEVWTFEPASKKWSQQFLIP